MPSDQSSHLFEDNFKYWKIFGIWGGRTPSKYYKYYSAIYLFITFLCYNILLTLNLIYTPRTIDLMLREVIFYFTEITVAAKAFTIVLLSGQLIEAFDIVDCDEFLGDYENKDGTVYKFHLNYKFCWKMYSRWSNFAFFGNVLGSLILNKLRGIQSDLPICQYYFLSNETRRSYFIVLLIYQSVGMYGHMMYNVNIDSFFAAIIYIAIVQLRILNQNLSNFGMSQEECKLPKELQDKIAIQKLNRYLRHYETILKYCDKIQEIFSIMAFIQFSVASLIICIVMCGLLLPSSIEIRVFYVLYLITMSMQIFVPGFLGTELTHESQELITAAYTSEWIPRSESFKRSLKLFMHRVTTPILITGLKLCPLSLLTFTSIMKTAYSFFTLIRNFQEQ